LNHDRNTPTLRHIDTLDAHIYI